MLKQKASLAFLRLLTAKKNPFASNVIECLTANAALFPDLPVPVEELTNLNNQLADALQNMQDGGRLARANLNHAITAWNNAFESNANYVTMVANGNVQIITRSGYDITKALKQDLPVPGSCKNLYAVALKAAGMVSISCNADPASKGYVTVATPQEDVTVTQMGNQLAITINGITAYVLVSTRSKTQFENMPAGKQLHIGTLAFNASGAGPLTNGQKVIPQ